jgi:hypothetical protein
MNALSDIDLWLAYYQSEPGRDCGIWQNQGGGSGTCPGIGTCDTDFVYKDYPSIIKAAGLNFLH